MWGKYIGPKACKKLLTVVLTESNLKMQSHFNSWLAHQDLQHPLSLALSVSIQLIVSVIHAAEQAIQNLVTQNKSHPIYSYLCGLVIQAEVRWRGHLRVCCLKSLREAVVLGVGGGSPLGGWVQGVPARMAHLCSIQFHARMGQPELLPAAVVAFQGGQEQKVQDFLWLRLGNGTTSPPQYSILLFKESHKAAQLGGVEKQVSPLDGTSCKDFVLFFISPIRKSI